jgi:hypothetical protein
MGLLRFPLADESDRGRAVDSICGRRESFASYGPGALYQGTTLAGPQRQAFSHWAFELSSDKHFGWRYALAGAEERVRKPVFTSLFPQGRLNFTGVQITARLKPRLSYGGFFRSLLNPDIDPAG